MAQKPLFVRFITLWLVLLAVAAVSFYLSLLLRLAHPVAAVVCLIVALVCFAATQIFQFSRLRFALRTLNAHKKRTTEESPPADARRP